VNTASTASCSGCGPVPVHASCKACTPVG
jgi:hypothetical protein